MNQCGCIDTEQTRRVFDAATTLGLPIKLHADQLSNLGGAALVADYGGLSADHIEFTDEDAVARMAVSTDLNPSTSPLMSLRLAMNLACTLFRQTPEEALRGATVNAAKALGLADRGRLVEGMRADIAVGE